jgi:sugar/nucleoside kinase (ribokinase family)
MEKKFCGGGELERRGITAAGNFIIDHIKVVDLWPDEGMLSLIIQEKRSTGGCACNVLIDLARLQTGIPLYGIGLVSNDEDGEFMIDNLKSSGVDVSMMQFMDDVSTSYTDVMTVESTGNRTFFHNKGVNKYLDIKHFDFSRVTTKIFHIGYILLLDTLDGPETEYGTRMARLLKNAKESGLKTSVDLVSESSYRFNKIVSPALKYTDYLILNEIEAGRTSGHEIRENDGGLNMENLKRTLDVLMEGGESELVCIHFPEGAYAGKKGSEPLFIPSHKCPKGYIASVVGAGDAFCAGMLYGIHEGWELERSMRFANAMAAVCLTDMTTSGGMKSVGETLQVMNELPLRTVRI